MTPIDDDRTFVEHPRFGRRPRVTGLNPETSHAGDVFLHWHSPKESRIPGTAIPANLARQSRATVPVTHYFDVKRRCRDCGRPFLFFAQEQKHWYEELGFPLEADCIRCADCRKSVRGVARRRERYEALFHVPDRTVEQELEMAECCLGLVEAAVFHPRQLEHVASILKRLPPGLDGTGRARADRLRARLAELRA